MTIHLGMRLAKTVQEIDIGRIDLNPSAKFPDCPYQVAAAIVYVAADIKAYSVKDGNVTVPGPKKAVCRRALRAFAAMSDFRKS